MKKNINGKVKEIVQALPDNYELTVDILKKLGNNDTKIKLDDDIKNSYYVFVNDTIYLANNEKARKDYSRLCLISHECWHSIQSKIMQKINFILSNIEIILFVICAVLLLFKLNFIFVPILYGLIVISSLIVRFILEFDAIKNSVILSKNYIEEKFDKDSSILVEKEFSKNIKKLLPAFILSVSISKICRYVLILILYLYIK